MLRGPKAALFDAVRRGIAEDVYPNDKLQYFSVASNTSIKANELQAIGIDGSGVGVAIVDSGVDGTHPDLARRMRYNVKMIDVIGTVTPPVSGVEPVTIPAIVVPIDQGPYSNSDTSSGHGTHVAGIVAADNTDGQVLGVAPGASLLGYGCGDTVFVFNVLTSYDDIIKKQLDKNANPPWNIRAVNNSWGSSFRLFDPDEPINQATRNLHANGIVVAFAAGNAATEMSLNPYSAAPWVISVGAGGLNKQRADFSSGGLEFDNAVLVEDLGTNQVKHLTFTGDRIGLYHPSFSTPGVNIVSTGTTGVAVTATPGGTATASGTSMASPHVAGTVALCIFSGGCAGLSPPQIIQKIRSDAAAYNLAHPDYGFLGDPLRPVTGKYYGYLIRAALY
jgi:serine protease AprX